tara:strand:- start:147 stop:353 length:207 start_codon:yes stop_codon:yes gene_type:complete
MEKYLSISKNPIFYKHKLFKHTKDKNVWFELVWFTDYGTSEQQCQITNFDFLKDAEIFINKKLRQLDK